MKAFLLVFAILLVSIGCHDSITVIKGCCDEPAKRVSVGLGSVFVPNVFTPNGDQVNDLLVIYGDSMKQIISMEIKNKDNDVVFYNLHFSFNNHDFGWDGSFAGKVVRGMYSYELKVESIDGYVKTIKGKVCNCPCDSESDEDIVPIDGCEFGICLPPDLEDCDPNEHLPCFAN